MNRQSGDFANPFGLHSGISCLEDEEASFLAPEELISKDNPFYMPSLFRSPSINALENALDTVNIDSIDALIASDPNERRVKPTTVSLSDATALLNEQNESINRQPIPFEVQVSRFNKLDEGMDLLEQSDELTSASGYDESRLSSSPSSVVVCETSSSLPCLQNKVSNDFRPKIRFHQKEQWMERYQELVKKYYKKNGRSHDSGITGKEDTPLARWVKRQRYNYNLRKAGKPCPLTDERVKLLDKLSFVWNPKEKAWEERFEALVAFKEKHKHCNVPSHYPPNQSLADWVKFMRHKQKHYVSNGLGSLFTLDRIIQLNELGFRWSGRPNNYKKRTQLDRERKCRMDHAPEIQFLYQKDEK